MTENTDVARRIGVGIGLVGWLAITCGSVLALGTEAIPWRTDLRRAEMEARAQDRLLWVQFTGAWCPNCVRLERESLVHPKIVGHARDSFVPVKLQSDQHEDLVDRFNLGGIPATILVDPSGEVVARHEGYLDAATFHAFLEAALIRSGRSPRPGVARTSATANIDGPRPALGGFCPVSLVEHHRLIAGAPAITLSYRGMVYRFADEAMRDVFRKQPERFLPINGGRCPVTHVERREIRPGDPRWCVLFRDHLFLCADESGRARFLKDPERYAGVALADHRPCPNCVGPEKRLVQATTRTSLAPAEPTPLEARRGGTEALQR